MEAAFSQLQSNESLSRRTVALIVLDGADVRMRYNQAELLAEKYMERFWAIDKGPAQVPYPQTPEYKLVRFLLPTLATVEGLPPHMQKWVDGRRDKTAKSIESNYFSAPIRIPNDAGAGFFEPPKNALAAYQKTAIAEEIHSTLAAVDDPTEHIYSLYESFKDCADDRARRIGEKALTLFMFGAGGKSFVKLVESTTQHFYEQAYATKQHGVSA